MEGPGWTLDRQPRWSIWWSCPIQTPRMAVRSMVDVIAMHVYQSRMFINSKRCLTKLVRLRIIVLKVCLELEFNSTSSIYFTRLQLFINLRATLDYGQEPWLWNCGGPWNSSEKLKFMCALAFKCSVKDMRSGSQPNVSSLPLYSYGLSYTLSSNKLRVVIFWILSSPGFASDPLLWDGPDAKSGQTWDLRAMEDSI